MSASTSLRSAARSALRLAAAALLVVVLASFPPLRDLLSRPLVVHDPEAKGSACYVLAGGGSIWERLDAASDLVHWGRVRTIILMQDHELGPYCFKAGRSFTRSEWAQDYLAWRGVPPNRIVWLPQVLGRFGTLTEARTVARLLPPDCDRLVLVSSAPHMRRSVLAFKRSLSPGIGVTPYAATGFQGSYELFHPIWVEYAKLLVYLVVS